MRRACEIAHHATHVPVIRSVQKFNEFVPVALRHVFDVGEVDV